MLLLLTSYTAFTRRMFFTVKSVVNTSGEITEGKTSQVLYKRK